MRIAICNINTLMPHTICDGYSREPHIDQQTDVAMSDSVDPYSFHTTGSTTTAYFVVQVGFCKWENTVIFVKLQRFQISFHLLVSN